MTPPTLSAGPNPFDAESAERRALTARCPECEFREGPFDSPLVARDRELKHVIKAHGKLIAYLRAKPLPSRNEGFARAVAGKAMEQAARLDTLAKGSSLIIGPNQAAASVDVAGELIAFIRNANKVNAAMLDILLEMRTGHPAIGWERKDGAAEPPPQEDPPQEDPPPPATDAPAEG